MKFVAYLFRVYLKSSIHIALAVSSLLYISMKSHHLDYDKTLYEFSFFGTIIAYNFIKYSLEVKRYFINSKKVMIPLILVSAVAALGAILALLKLSYNQILLVLGMGILIYLYTIPFIPSLPNFRNLSRIKIFIVAAVWSGISCLLPLIDTSTSLLYLECIQRFIFVLVLMIPFEIRDLKYDEPNLKTLAQSLGIIGVKRLGYLLVLLWLLISVYLQHISIYLSVLVSLFLILALLYSTVDRKRVFTEFWVESIPIVYALTYAFL